MCHSWAISHLDLPVYGQRELFVTKGWVGAHKTIANTVKFRKLLFSWPRPPSYYRIVLLFYSPQLQIVGFFLQTRMFSRTRSPCRWSSGNVCFNINQNFCPTIMIWGRFSELLRYSTSLQTLVWNGQASLYHSSLFSSTWTTWANGNTEYPGFSLYTVLSCTLALQYFSSIPEIIDHLTIRG